MNKEKNCKNFRPRNYVLKKKKEEKELYDNSMKKVR